MTSSSLAGDRTDYMRYWLIADAVAKEPVRLQVTLEHIDRWLGNGHWAKKRLMQWREVIAAAIPIRGLRPFRQAQRAWPGWYDAGLWLF